MRTTSQSFWQNRVLILGIPIFKQAIWKIEFCSKIILRFYCSIGLATSCTPCIAGYTYNPEPGGSECLPCPDGYLCPDPAQDPNQVVFFFIVFGYSIACLESVLYCFVLYWTVWTFALCYEVFLSLKKHYSSKYISTVHLYDSLVQLIRAP